jgi:dipeptidyl aminopeptidase/acylaminoacyl peptidase
MTLMDLVPVRRLWRWFIRLSPCGRRLTIPARHELIGDTPAEQQIHHYSLEERADSNTPPTFLLHAVDDPAVKVENSVVMFSALRRLGVPVEMHLFEQGAHGFGIRDAQGYLPRYGRI